MFAIVTNAWDRAAGILRFSSFRVQNVRYAMPVAGIDEGRASYVLFALRQAAATADVRPPSQIYLRNMDAL
jgi:hypothetical protein